MPNSGVRTADSQDRGLITFLTRTRARAGLYSPARIVVSGSVTIPDLPAPAEASGAGKHQAHQDGWKDDQEDTHELYSACATERERHGTGLGATIMPISIRPAGTQARGQKHQ